MDTQFETWRAFADFEREVSASRRYVRSRQAEQFLQAVRISCHDRTANLSKGRGFWRARVGFEWKADNSSGIEVPSPYAASDMKPLRDRATEGRANSKGIPVLYLCTSKVAAMSEVRPWLGSLISLGFFETSSPLRLVDCTRGQDGTERFYFKEPPEEERDAAVWSQIDRAFSKPVQRSDDKSDYVATQILSELFRDAGYDGLVYRSAFGETSFNIALFDLDSAELSYCELHEVTQAKLNFQERANPYWVRRATRPSRKRPSKK